MNCRKTIHHLISTIGAFSTIFVLLEQLGFYASPGTENYAVVAELNISAKASISRWVL
jgi:hypothetical protein